ncbi:MAG TPA: o-succinylbenzoate synthase [Polyangiaceae bacterium]|nr:o-succinylbenzoate synthase [Polyangiaceae bacterium]
MTLALSLASAERTLSRAARNARQGWATRAACILTLKGDTQYGLGEASPLPGFSPDSLEQCQTALAAVDPARLPARLEPGQSARVELARASAQLPRGVPAARAALEGALLDLWSRSAQKPAWALLLDTDASPPARRAVAALLMAEPEQALEQAQHAHTRGIRTFKLKIGRPGALEREIAALESLRRKFGANVHLRLDANQSFSGAQARACLPRFAEHGLEYIEEPCPRGDLARLAELGLPLALDESLMQLAEDVTGSQNFDALKLSALILKPTLLGGASACCEWADIAARIGAKVILSHAFEGPVGLGLSAALALSIGSETSAQGLDLEGARLEHLKPPFFSGAHLEAWSEVGFGDWQGSL